jgi:hypothetical protein
MFISVVVAMCISVAIITFSVHECYYYNMFINVVVGVCSSMLLLNIGGVTTTLMFINGVAATSMVLL